MHKGSETLRGLVEAAEKQNFVSTMADRDLDLLTKSLRRIKMEATWHAKFVGQFAEHFEIGKTPFGKYSQNRFTEAESGHPSGKSLLPNIEPWEEEVDGKKLLEALTKLIGKHVYISPQKALVVALWILWTYLLQENFVEYSPF